MADTKAKAAAKPGEKKPRVKPGTIKENGKKAYGKVRNYDLGNGVYRFSRSKMYHKKGLWKFVGKKNPKKEKPKKKQFIIKPIGGEKNGGTRKVMLTRKTASYPTCDRIRKRPAKKCFKDHIRRLRPGLTPGTVCIVLAGVHKGKRVVFLKQLGSGLLLVTGPYKYNGCPLRRINKMYVIATSTKLDLSEVKYPAEINDDYFKRIKSKKPKKEEGDIFVAKKEKYKASDKRKEDQKKVDSQVLAAIKKTKQTRMMRRYLGSMFALRSSQYPHRMKF